MKLPRFSLRMLLVALAILCIPMAWVGYQLNWIHQRHAFLQREDVEGTGFKVNGESTAAAPWPLRLFGEDSIFSLGAPNELSAEAKRLFPEAIIHDNGGKRLLQLREK